MSGVPRFGWPPIIGDQLDEITLTGDPEQPTVAVIFHPRWAKNVRWSFEWRLRDCGDEDCAPSDMDPLAVLLVDHLGNAVQESLETSPGLPLWEPDADGVIHVNMTSKRFFNWPQESDELGRPWWLHEEGRLVTMDWETREHRPWKPPEGHPWESLDP